MLISRTEPDASKGADGHGAMPTMCAAAAVSRSFPARVAHLLALPSRPRLGRAFVTLATATLLIGCASETKKSAELAGAQMPDLLKAAHEDVRQIREGLPQGGSALATLLPPPDKGELDAATAREALEKARNKVQDLRIAKSTFFALVAPSGVVIRNDQPQDRMAGKNLFDSFPGLKKALDGGYVEARGSMPEAAEVRGRPDAEWVAAVPVGAAPARAVYATGWSWSAYAYRLENAARSSARGSATDPHKVPLLYVYIVVGKDVYGAPISPDVNAKAVREQNVLEKLHGAEPIRAELEITGRGFGLAAVALPEFGSDVAVVLLRSET
jgi:hypothetical protein